MIHPEPLLQSNTPSLNPESDIEAGQGLALVQTWVWAAAPEDESPVPAHRAIDDLNKSK